MVKTYKYKGWRLVLDSKQIFPADPGAGTPAMVYGPQDTSGTYWCVCSTGEIDGWLELPADVAKWLDNIGESVDLFMSTHTPT